MEKDNEIVAIMKTMSTMGIKDVKYRYSIARDKDYLVAATKDVEMLYKHDCVLRLEMHRSILGEIMYFAERCIDESEDFWIRGLFYSSEFGAFKNRHPDMHYEVVDRL